MIIHFGERLAQLIVKHNLTQSKLAQLVGKSQGNISRMTKEPGMKAQFIAQVCSVTDIQPVEFFGMESSDSEMQKEITQLLREINELRKQLRECEKKVHSELD